MFKIRIYIIINCTIVYRVQYYDIICLLVITIVVLKPINTNKYYKLI